METVSADACTVAVLLRGGVVLGALQGGGVPADGVAGVGPHEGQGRHAVAVDVVPVVVAVAHAVTDAVGAAVDGSRHGVDGSVADDAAVDAHAVTVVTGALMPVAGHTIKQSSGPDQLRLQGG